MSDKNINDDSFIGTWVLDPTQSDYKFGMPPKSGTYQFEPDGDGLKVTVVWESADKQSFEIAYFGFPDEDNPAIADTLSMTWVDANTLDSTTKKDGRVILYARRVLSEADTVMTITQPGPTPDGQQYHNISVYKKQRGNIGGL